MSHNPCPGIPNPAAERNLMTRLDEECRQPPFIPHPHPHPGALQRLFFLEEPYPTAFVRCGSMSNRDPWG